MISTEDFIDAPTIRTFVETVHTAAERALKGAKDPGVLQLVRITSKETVLSTPYAIGQVDDMVDAAIQAASSGMNVYVEARTVKSRRGHGRGTVDDTVGVFAFVDDSDADTGKAGSLSIEPSLVVETSPGNQHRWLFFDRALTADEAKPIGAAMRAATQSDSATGKVTQPYRVAGTPNFPNAKKAGRGRVVTPTSIVLDEGPVWSKDALQAAFLAVSGDQAREAPRGRTGKSSDTVEEIVAETGDDRSGQFFYAVMTAIDAGMLPADLEEAMQRHPNGCASKYLEPTDRLRKEIDRAWAKAARAEKPLKQPLIAPTYPDNGVAVEVARDVLRKIIKANLTAGSGVHAIKVDTGVGKTRITVQAIAADIDGRRALHDKRAFLYTVPTLRLADEVAELFKMQGVVAQVLRGRNAEDPNHPDTGLKMCLDPEAVALALSSGWPVSKSCCYYEDPDTGTTSSCAFLFQCEYQKQLRIKPDVWVGCHGLLFHPPSVLSDLAGVVIDEAFWSTGLDMPEHGLALDDIEASLLSCKPVFGVTTADLQSYRSKLVRAFRRQDKPGGVERRHLEAEGIDIDTCLRACANESLFQPTASLRPGMDAHARRAVARAVETSKLLTMAPIWTAARELLQHIDPAAISGRLILADENRGRRKNKVRVVKAGALKPIAKALADVPTLILDATLPDIAVLKAFYSSVEIVAHIEAKTHAHTRQVLGAPTSANKLLHSKGEWNLHMIRRAVLYRFLQAGHLPTLVIAQKEVSDWLRTSGLPSGITLAHFNAVAGLDGFKNVRLVIVIGRTLPRIEDVEASVGVITGMEAGKIPKPVNGKPSWYSRPTLAIRMADGSGRAIEGDRHPDPLTEALRWQICEAGSLQAIGRARAVNRTASNPVHIEIWSDLVLPVTVDEVAQWKDIPSGSEIVMLMDGIFLESSSDMSSCWAHEWPTEESAKQWRKRRARCQIPIETLYKEMTPCSFRYQCPGVGQKWRNGWFDPVVIPDPRAWLEAKIGLSGFKLETSAENATTDFLSNAVLAADETRPRSNPGRGLKVVSELFQGIAQRVDEQAAQLAQDGVIGRGQALSTP